MIYLRFGLINEYGEQFRLDDFATGYLVDVEGLNFEDENGYSEIGSNYIRNFSHKVQKKISGTVIFGRSDIYQKEEAFKNFVKKSKRLTFVCQTPIATKQIDVDVTVYALAHVGMNTLGCPITFTAKSLWYEIATQTYEAQTSEALRYAFRFDGRFNDFANGEYPLTNDGWEEAALELELFGALSNPIITVESNGTEIYRVVLEESISDGEKIIYSSVDGNLYCYSGSNAAVENFKRTGVPNGLTNLVPTMNILNTNFFKIPVGDSVLKITADSALTEPVTISTYKYYKVV